MSALAGPDPSKLTERTGLAELGLGWLETAGRAGKSWPGPAEQFTPPYTLTAVYFSESVGSRHFRSIWNVYSLFINNKRIKFKTVQITIFCKYVINKAGFNLLSKTVGDKVGASLVI